jgi:hypothetical protein
MTFCLFLATKIVSLLSPRFDVLQEKGMDTCVEWSRQMVEPTIPYPESKWMGVRGIIGRGLLVYRNHS